MPISIDGSTLTVETPNLHATFEHGALTSLVPRALGRDLLAAPSGPGHEGEWAPWRSPVSLTYSGGETVPVLRSYMGTVTHTMLSASCCLIAMEGWEADGSLRITADEASGDLLIEPAGFAARSGVRGVRWNLRPLAADVRLVAPIFQGVDARATDPLLAGSWAWPTAWEAGFAILQAEAAGCMVWCQDAVGVYKTLHVGGDAAAGALAFEAENPGPWDGTRTAGGLVWRISAHEGDWQEAAKRYRAWLWHAAPLASAAASRPPWVADVRFAVSWCPTDPRILEAIAERIEPNAVLIHLPNWRNYGYDEFYPDYEASPEAERFMAAARRMGFHVMPHLNANQLDPSHPFFDRVRDFQYQQPASHRLHGWAWWREAMDSGDLGCFSVPQAYSQLKGHRDKKVMASIHPGLTAWRNMMSATVAGLVRAHGLDGVFTDVTLTTWNLENCLVEGLTPTQGMARLIDELASVCGGIAVCGEGLNETTMPRQAFAQAHLFKSHQTTLPGAERVVAPVNAYVFDGLCRAFGYSGLSGQTEESVQRMAMHERQGAIPTVTLGAASEIREPNAAVARCLEIARS